MHKIVPNHRKFILRVFIISFWDMLIFINCIKKPKIDIIAYYLEKNKTKQHCTVGTISNSALKVLSVPGTIQKSNMTIDCRIYEVHLKATWTVIGYWTVHNAVVAQISFKHGWHDCSLLGVNPNESQQVACWSIKCFLWLNGIFYVN